MRLGFLAATDKILGETDYCVSAWPNFDLAPTPARIRQCLGPRGWYGFDEAQAIWAKACSGASDSALVKAASAAASSAARSSAKKLAATRIVDKCRAHQRLDIAGIERQGALEKAARLRHMSGVDPLFTQAMP